jgi:hypothetical protein
MQITIIQGRVFADDKGQAKNKIIEKLTADYEVEDVRVFEALTQCKPETWWEWIAKVGEVVE